MKNLFNNPWFITSLGIGAVVYVVISIVLPLFNGSVSTAGADVPPFEMNTTIAEEDSAGGSPQPSRPDLEGALGSRVEITWLDNAERDPFAPSLDTPAPTTQLQLPSVDALFVGSDRQSAVLNDRLVRVGDQVGEFEVTHIEVSHVLVRRGRHTYRLEPEV